jgi:nicotinamidase-related amidase
MPRNHGSFPDRAPVALLLIDVINDFDFTDHSSLLEQAIPMAKRLAALKRRAKTSRVPSIYVNDNFGRWKSDFQHIVQLLYKLASSRRFSIEVAASEKR